MVENDVEMHERARWPVSGRRWSLGGDRAYMADRHWIAGGDDRWNAVSNGQEGLSATRSRCDTGVQYSDAEDNR